MFYLKTFFAVFCKKPIRAFVFGLLCVLFFTSMFQRPLVARYCAALGPQEEAPYFYALLWGDLGALQVQDKMSKLPGVKSVESKTADELKTQVSKSLSELEMGLPESIKQMKMEGLRINLDPKTNSISQQLIREYLSKLVGVSNLVMTDLKLPPKRPFEKYEVIARSFGSIILSATLFVLWFIFLYSFRSALYQEAYLIENFQRRDHVAFKSILAGLGLFFGASLGIAFIISAQTFAILESVIALLLVILLSLPFLRKKTWTY